MKIKVLINELGNKFGMLTVVGRVPRAESDTTNATWLCRCDCGKDVTAEGIVLRSGGITNCGCTWRGQINIGEKFHHLTVIGRVGRSNGKYNGMMMLVRCECGREKTLRSENLRHNTKTCGHKDCEFHKALYANKKQGRPPGESQIRDMVGRYRQGARLRDIEFNITEADMKVLGSGDCHYCGIRPLGVWSKNRTFNGQFPYNGIDRVDSTRGYFQDNVVSCCYDCNRAKKSMSKQEFLEWIERVYYHSAKHGKRYTFAGVAA